MDWCGWRICFGVPSDFRNKKDIARQCLEVANAAHFPTDYDDVFSHLFGNESYIICTISDKDGKLGGFSIFAKLEDIDTLYSLVLQASITLMLISRKFRNTFTIWFVKTNSRKMLMNF